MFGGYGRAVRTPKIVRNVFCEMQVDGRKSPINTGPKSASGGLKADFFIRDQGAAIKSVTVESGCDGKNVFLQVIADGQIIFSESHPR